MSTPAVSECPAKAMILAAGEGSRLRPLTERIPKGMIPVGGKPVLQHALEWLRGYGVREVVINLCHLPDPIRDHFGDGRRWGVRIEYSPEDRLLGTAGGVKQAARYFQEPFLVWYGDNLSTCRLDRLWRLHRARGGLATIALHYREDPSQSGIVAVDARDRITRFLEKPQPHQMFGRWVNAGILVLDPAALETIPADRPTDFGKDIFPAWLEAGKPLYGYRMSPAEEKLVWIDTLADLGRAEGRWGEEATG